MCIRFIVFLFYIHTSMAVIGKDPLASYFDGNEPNHCRPTIERKITGFSGIVYSHAHFGRKGYNGSGNCFMQIIAPKGYRVRLKVLEFDVHGYTSDCSKDSLHVFDYEEEMSLPSKSSSDDHGTEPNTPGPIIGQFCGTIKNKSELSISTKNALTLWWHSSANKTVTRPASGFKLLWTAFRNSTKGCSSDEFACGDGDCIPLQLACDRFADCNDGSDLKRENQFAVQCENVDFDALSSISGLYVLLVSAALVVFVCLCCGTVCICCRCLRQETPKFKGDAAPLSVQRKGAAEMLGFIKPDPPQFFPPSPPKIPPPSTASSYTPRRLYGTPASSSDGYRTVKLPHEYNGRPLQIDQLREDDYTYVRNDIRTNLL